jgi:hypothetical protein
VYVVFSWVKKVAKAGLGVNDNHAMARAERIFYVKALQVCAGTVLAFDLDRKCFYGFN